MMIRLLLLLLLFRPGEIFGRLLEARALKPWEVRERHRERAPPQQQVGGSVDRISDQHRHRDLLEARADALYMEQKRYIGGALNRLVAPVAT
jgi:hypothetical protein